MCRCERRSLLSAAVNCCRYEMIRGNSARPGRLPRPSSVGAEKRLYSWKLSDRGDVRTGSGICLRNRDQAHLASSCACASRLSPVAFSCSAKVRL